ALGGGLRPVRRALCADPRAPAGRRPGRLRAPTDDRPLAREPPSAAAAPARGSPGWLASCSSMCVRWRRAGGNVLSIVLAALAALIVVRALLPGAIQRYVNHVLDRSETHRGRIGDVDLHLLRGAYEIEDVEIFERGGALPVP